MEQRELDEGRRTVSTKSGEISYIDIGTGPAALFVHGVGTNAYLWRHVIGALAPARRCLAIDLPLHGQTPVGAGQDLSVAGLASVLEDFCDALDLAGIDLVANDTGGAVAQVFAARNSRRLATFTLTNCDTAGNLPPEGFKPVVEMAAAGALAPAMAELMGDIARPGTPRSARRTSTPRRLTSRSSAPTWSHASAHRSGPGSSSGCSPRSTPPTWRRWSLS